MKTLHLTLKKKWFDMIDSGKKIDEYREIKKYWCKRLCEDFDTDSMDIDTVMSYSPKYYDRVSFRNGYSKTAKQMSFKLHELRIDTGLPEWGAEPHRFYFVIKLGERID